MIWLKEFFGQLMERVKINEVSTFNGERWEPKSWPKDAEGLA
jgi:hydrogenase large subunit